jgi:hypothetical protein
MATSTLRHIQAAELARRLETITSRLWMLRDDAAAPLADRLAAGIVLPPRTSAPDEEPSPAPLGVALLLH